MPMHRHEQPTIPLPVLGSKKVRMSQPLPLTPDQRNSVRELVTRCLFSPGTFVRHRDHGEGRIRSRQGDQCIVQFKEIVTKAFEDLSADELVDIDPQTFMGYQEINLRCHHVPVSELALVAVASPEWIAIAGFPKLDPI